MNRSAALGVIIAIIIVALVGGLIWYSSTQPTQTTEPTTTTPNTSPNNTTNPESESSNNQNQSIITFTDSGFTPSSLTIKAGETITIKNNSESPVQFSSDDHPTHREHPEINMQALQPGQEGQLTIAEAGTYTYHDHLDPRHTGTIVVTD